MMLFLFFALWIWRWLRRPQASPEPLIVVDEARMDTYLIEARKTHPEEMEKVDFASWELQMETEEPWS